MESPRAYWFSISFRGLIILLIYLERREYTFYDLWYGPFCVYYIVEMKEEMKMTLYKAHEKQNFSFSKKKKKNAVTEKKFDIFQASKLIALLLLFEEAKSYIIYDIQ